MTEGSSDRGARRRAATREVLGKPGSMRRWLVGTAVWLLACSIVFAYVDSLARIAVFLIAVAVAYAGFRARPIFVGDEDELHAALKRERSIPPRPSGYGDEEVRADPADWLSRGARNFDGVPPPPILDEQTGAAAADGAAGPGEGRE